MTDQTPMKDERTMLKERADQMGLEYKDNIPTAKLKGLIADALNQSNNLDELDAEDNARKEHAAILKEQNKLVRFRLTCMNPNKKDWPGEIITVCNSFGTFRKYIPFNATDGWHAPQIIVNMLQERSYQQFYTVPTANGQSVTKTKLTKEFAIEILPPLSEEELGKLNNYVKATEAADDHDVSVSTTGL